MNKFKKITSSVLAVLLLAACSKSEYKDYYEEREVANSEFLEQIKSQGNDAFAQALVQYGFDERLASSNLYTVIVPDAAAFQQAISGMSDLEKEVLLAFHILPNSLFGSDFIPGKDYETLSGKYLNYDGEQFEANGVDFGAITSKDLRVKNGVIHQVNGVFVPLLSLDERMQEGYNKFRAALNHFVDPVNGTAEWFNPANELENITVLAVHDSTYTKTFGFLEGILEGYEGKDDEMEILFKQMLPNHIFLGSVDSTSLVSNWNRNINNIPNQLSSDNIVASNMILSNGMMHELADVYLDESAIQSKVDEFYQQERLPIGSPSNFVTANSTRNRGTDLSKMAIETEEGEGFATWAYSAESYEAFTDTVNSQPLPDSYLFFYLNRELVGNAKYRLVMEHEVDSLQYAKVSIAVNDVQISEAVTPVMPEGASYPYVAETTLAVLQFDTYQAAPKFRLDAQANADSVGTAQDILKIKALRFEPVADDELEEGVSPIIIKE